MRFAVIDPLGTVEIQETLAETFEEVARPHAGI